MIHECVYKHGMYCLCTFTLKIVHMQFDVQAFQKRREAWDRHVLSAPHMMTHTIQQYEMQYNKLKRWGLFDHRGRQLAKTALKQCSAISRMRLPGVDAAPAQAYTLKHCAMDQALPPVPKHLKPCQEEGQCFQLQHDVAVAW